MKQTLQKLSMLTASFLLFGAVFSTQATTPSSVSESYSDKSESVANQQSDKVVSESTEVSGQKANRPDESSPPQGTRPQKRYYVQTIPNDPFYSPAWHLQAVKAPAAWSITTGSTNVTVAVIDSGFALNHQDLAAHWKYNAGESGGGKESDGTDNDGNGYVDDFRGWDFVSGDNNPSPGSENPNGTGVSHGTEVAGLVGAVGNNGVGTTAVSQAVSIMPLRVINDNDAGYTDDVADAIYYAVDNGADVINMSLGTSGDDPYVREAIDYAYDNNVVVVAAAGNCGNAGTGGACTGSPTGYITFPASYNRVIAVGATTNTGARASFSSFGQRLDVVAPGSGSITSPTWLNSNGTSLYKTTLHGTSYASPITASAVALIKSIRPDSTVDDIRALIMGGAAKLGGMNGLFYTQQLGHGILDVERSVTIASDLEALQEEIIPVLYQSGGTQSERSYGSNETLGSGCENAVDTWCTVWFRNNQLRAERFLPYQKVGQGGQTGWNFGSSALLQGLWEIRARQGNAFSDTPYQLIRK